jgi:hypothetical protein
VGGCRIVPDHLVLIDIEMSHGRTVGESMRNGITKHTGVAE